MKIIDIHTHIYPEKIARKATDSVRDFYHIQGSSMDGTVDMLLRRGKEAGISQYLVLPVANAPNRVQSINDFIVEQTKQHDCFVGFGTVHARMEGICEETQRIMTMGLRGIKMHPDSQRFCIDDIRLYPVYDLIQGKVPVLLHMGDQRYNYSHPVRLRRILEAFPQLEVIAAHFGGYSMYEIAAQELQGKNCFFDVSSSLMFMEAGVAEKYINHYGAERFVYGSDFPMWNPVKEMERFMRLKLTDDQKEQIAHITAERILKI